MSALTKIGALGLFLISCWTFPIPAGAEGASSSSARAILDRVRQLDDTERAWRDRTRRMNIVIHDGRGGQRLRDLTMSTLREKGEDEKTLAVFESPPEIRGTAFLQFHHPDRDSDQWLYLPELRRVRRITSSVKNESFMGTDFSFRDLELLSDVLEWDESEAESRLLGEADVDGVEAYRIELRPAVRDVGYRRIVITLSAGDLVLRAMELYAAGEEPVKSLELGGIERVGRIPTAHRMIMRQPAEGTWTAVDISDVVYDRDLPAERFTQRSLERGAGEP